MRFSVGARFPALTYRNYRLFWFGQFVSLIGSWMQSTTQPYLAYRLTSRPFDLGLVGFAGTLPALLLMLPAGVLIERWDRRRTVIVMQAILMLQALTLGILTVTGMVTFTHILILALVQGTANAVEITARQAMLAELVPKESLPNAIALNSTIFNAARVLGPSLAAPFLVLIQGNGEGWAFIANGVSYLFVLVGLLMMDTRSVIEAPTGKKSLLDDFLTGQRYIRATPLVALLIFMVTIPGLFGFPFMQQIPVFARDVLQTAADTAGSPATRNSLMITFQGIGALIASLSIAYFSGFRRKGLVLMAGQLAFAGALIGLSFARQIELALPFMVLLGWGMVSSLALTNTLIQLTVPNNLRGRVMSTYLWAMQGVAPFGSLLIGGLVQSLGAPTAVMLGGAACAVVAVAVHSATGIVRRVAA